MAETLSRADLFKIVMPGGWINEARTKGITNLSNPASTSLKKDALLLGSLTLVGCGSSTQQNYEPPLPTPDTAYLDRQAKAIEHFTHLRTIDEYSRINPKSTPWEVGFVSKRKGTTYKPTGSFQLGSDQKYDTGVTPEFVDTDDSSYDVSGHNSTVKMSFSSDSDDSVSLNLFYSYSDPNFSYDAQDYANFRLPKSPATSPIIELRGQDDQPPRLFFSVGLAGKTKDYLGTRYTYNVRFYEQVIQVKR